MTCLPPTLGHLRLIQFSSKIAPTTVIVSTQPDEPYASERYSAIRDSVPNNVSVQWFHEQIEQNAEAPGFWDNWRRIMGEFGFNTGDYIVASEPYGKTMAEEIGGVFVPYDLNRTISPIKATRVRNGLCCDKVPWSRFNEMIPAFRKDLVQRVTIFGADSCGKTTLASDLARDLKMNWLFEWARPYLEGLDDVAITAEKMYAIWQGQKALQESADYLDEHPFIFQDTDLFSTLGYWEMWDGGAPAGLEEDCISHQSDLYIITPSSIPFEPDPLRYGGDQRETPDQYWIDLCERFNLNYVVLTTPSRFGRVYQVEDQLAKLWEANVHLHYERKFN